MITKKDKMSPERSDMPESGKSVRIRRKGHVYVYRSLNNIYVQIINDQNGTTLVAASTLDPDLKGQVADKTKNKLPEL